MNYFQMNLEGQGAVRESADMKRTKVTSPSGSDSSDQSHPLKTRNSGDSGQTGDNGQTSNASWGAFLDMRSQILLLLSSKLSPSAIKGNLNRMEIMKKCSYYLNIHRHDVPPSDQPQPQLPQLPGYMSNSTVTALIDPWKLQRMKKLANSQVKLQLSLLEELYGQLEKGREELEAIANQCDLHSAGQDEQGIRKKIRQVVRTLQDFDYTLAPGRLHLKHRLIPDSGNTKLPQISLSLSIKMPVVFDKTLSQAKQDCVVLHWVIAGQVPQETEQQFEVHYRILQPANAVESTHLGTVTCSDYSIQINNLIPERCYEFSVKRADACYLVYSLWADTMVLRTKPGARVENREKKRRMFPW